MEQARPEELQVPAKSFELNLINSQKSDDVTVDSHDRIDGPTVSTSFLCSKWQCGKMKNHLLKVKIQIFFPALRTIHSNPLESRSDESGEMKMDDGTRFLWIFFRDESRVELEKKDSRARWQLKLIYSI